jgi:hypothetical protein
MQAGTEARIEATAGLGADTLMSIGKDDQVLYNVIIGNVTMQARGGRLMDVVRTQNLILRNNVFTGTAGTPPVPGVSTWATSGVIRANYFTTLLGAAFLAAGYPQSPANVVFQQNRVTGNRNGIQLVGTSDGIPQAGTQLIATVQNNDLSSNGGNPGSAALRLMVKGTEALGSANVSSGNIIAIVQSNQISNNAIGVAMDAGFPYRTTAAGTCDPRDLTGSLQVTFSGNTMSGNAQPPVISFTRLQTTLGVPAAPPSAWQYLRGATFALVDSNRQFTGAQIDHRASDPWTGACGDGALNNRLTINGIVIQPN